MVTLRIFSYGLPGAKMFVIFQKRHQGSLDLESWVVERIVISVLERFGEVFCFYCLFFSFEFKVISNYTNHMQEIFKLWLTINPRLALIGFLNNPALALTAVEPSNSQLREKKNTKKSRFFEPTRETKIGLNNRLFREIGGKIRRGERLLVPVIGSYVIRLEESGIRNNRVTFS